MPETLRYEKYRRKVGQFLHHRLPALVDKAGNLEFSGCDTHYPLQAFDGSTNVLDLHFDVSSHDVSQIFDVGPVNERKKPVLVGSDITDFGDAAFVADPFLFPHGDDWHMFFEIYNPFRSPDAAIGHAVQTEEGTWVYDRIVLETEYHLSFPYVFKWNNSIYMLPEQADDTAPGKITLFVAESFPHKWAPANTIIENGEPTGDAIVFVWNHQWWMIVDECSSPGTLLAFYSDSLLNGDWIPHRSNPIVTNRPAAARPAGRPIVTKNRIYVFYQDLSSQYGKMVRMYEITHLSPDSFVDRELINSPVLMPSNRIFAWNSGRMHHIDPWFIDGTWHCAVDGNIGFGDTAFTARNWSIDIYTT